MLHRDTLVKGEGGGSVSLRVRVVVLLVGSRVEAGPEERRVDRVRLLYSSRTDEVSRTACRLCWLQLKDHGIPSPAHRLGSPTNAIPQRGAYLPLPKVDLPESG